MIQESHMILGGQEGDDKNHSVLIHTHGT